MDRNITKGAAVGTSIGVIAKEGTALLRRTGLRMTNVPADVLGTGFASGDRNDTLHNL